MSWTGGQVLSPFRAAETGEGIRMHSCPRRLRLARGLPRRPADGEGRGRDILSRMPSDELEFETVQAGGALCTL